MQVTKKPKWREAIAGRRLRWRASRALVAAAPALRRPLHFLGQGLGVGDAPGRRVFETGLTVETPLEPALKTFVAERCGRYDGVFQPNYYEAPWRFQDEYFELENVYLLGHTGQLVDQAYRGVITPWGAPANWNHDKIARLADGAPVEGVAVPIRRYRHYFHFLAEIAVPLAAYFESGAAARAPHTLVVSGSDRMFYRQTIDALAVRYGLAVRALPVGERLFAARALAFRRTRPCEDWWPVSRATADALRDLLLAHLAPPPLVQPGRRLYLRRGREKMRNLHNVDAVDRFFEARGFELFQPAQENFAQQIQKAGAADVIVALHGAALANLHFARPGAHVVEIFSADFAKSVFVALSQMLGLSHHLVDSPASDQNWDFTMDLDALARALDHVETRLAAAAVPPA